MVVCSNCLHRRQFHKKVDGNAWCSVPFCACREFKEATMPSNRRQIHKALDQFLDETLSDIDER